MKQKTIVNRSYGKQSGVEGVLGCKIKIVALPLLADHMLREANHYLRMLNTFNRIG